MDGAIPPCEEVESLMEIFDPDAVGEFLGFKKIVCGEQCIFPDHIRDVVLLHPFCEPVMTVAVELEPQGAPGGNPEIAEPEILIDEVEVIVEAFAGTILEKGIPRGFVMPRIVTRAGFHGGEDMDKACYGLLYP